MMTDFLIYPFKPFLFLRAEKQLLHEKLNQGEKVEEVDDSGFYAGTITYRPHLNLRSFFVSIRS